MLRRLITAVTAVALVAGFATTAYSGPDDNKISGDQAVQMPVRTAPAKVETLAGFETPPGFQRYTPLDASLNGQLPSYVGSPGVQSPDTVGCFFEDNGVVDGVFTCGSVSGFRIFANDGFECASFIPINQANHFADVDAVEVWVRQAELPDAVGDAELVIRFYGDAGGLPGAFIDERRIPWTDITLDTLPFPGVIQTFPIAPVTIAGGDGYHVSVALEGSDLNLTTIIAAINPTAAGGACGGLANENVSSLFIPASGGGPIWLDNTSAFGVDLGFAIGSSHCEYFSDCYVNFPFGGFVFGWQVPDPAWTTGQVLNGFGQRFVAEGPETLQNVRVRPISDWAFSLPDFFSYGPTSTNGYLVEIWNDDGTGSIDVGAGPIDSRTVPGGIANIYPGGGNEAANGVAFETIIVDFTSSNLVLLGPYHVTVKTTSDNPADGSPFIATDNFISNPQTGGSVNFVAPDPNWELFENSNTWTLDIGGGVPQAGGFYVQAELCRDEFAECQTQVLHGPNGVIGPLGSGFVSSPLLGGLLEGAQLVLGSPINRAEVIRFLAADDALFGPPPVGSPDIEATIYANAGGIPGALLYTQPVPVVNFNGWTEVVIPGGFQVLGDFFVGYRNVSADPDNNFFYFGLNTDPEINGGAFVGDGLGSWFQFTGTRNHIIDVDFCSVPVDERPCLPDANWATRGFDYQRTSASGVALGDAWCDLTTNWIYVDPAQPMSFNGPIIYKDQVICAFVNKYVILDLVTGAVLDEVTSADDPFSIGPNIRSTPSAAEIGGVDYLFLAGGTSSFSAWDITTLPATVVWSNNGFNAWQGNTQHGGIRYGTSVLLDLGGTTGLYYADDNGQVHGVDALTGLALPGWVTPTMVGGSLISGATDGANQVFFTAAGAPGDVYAIDATTGAINWQLSTAAGLQAINLTGLGAENFNSVSVDLGRNAVYATSVIGDVAGTLQLLPDGISYNLNAATGADLAPASVTQGSFLASPLVDANRVINLSFYTFVVSPTGTPIGGQVFAVGKNNNAIVWANGAVPQRSGSSGYLTEGLLTCEVNAADLLVGFDFDNYLTFMDADNGDNIFHRRTTFTGGGRSGALGLDGGGVEHLVFGHGFGVLFDLIKGAVDVPRLDILSLSAQQAVPFGSPADTLISFPDMYANTGCADLVCSLFADDTPVGGFTLSLGTDVVRERALSDGDVLATQLTNDWSKGKALQVIRTNPNDFLPNRDTWNADNNDRYRGSAALAVPAFLNSNGTYAGDVFDPPGGDIITPPGSSSPITVRANGPLVNRGPNTFFVTMRHNDATYFMEGGGPDPEFTLALVGGCLLDSTFLAFGSGAANTQIVYNAGRIAGSGFGWDIDGDASAIFQGSYVYGVSQFRVAMNTPQWAGGVGSEGDWISMQADPNFCDGSCTPNLTTGVMLGSFSTDGLTYDPIMGNVVCKSYIDSVQNFFDGVAWDWDFLGLSASAPFDNDSTMGLAVNTSTYGVVDAPTGAELLHDGTLEVMTFKNRNATAIPDWKLWTIMDYDLWDFSSGGDTAVVDQSISTAWSWDIAGNNPAAWGFVKLPFGCGETPLKNAYSLDAAQAQFTDAIYWDSAYFYSSLPAGNLGQPIDAIATGAPDHEAHFTFAEHDFAGVVGDSLKLGFVFFRTTPTVFEDPAEYADIANLWNKFAGFGRGDVDNDNVATLADIIYLVDYLFGGGAGPVPFLHLGDVDGSGGAPALADVNYLVNFYFNYGPCPVGAWEL